MFATLAAYLDRFLVVRDLRGGPYGAAKAAVESSDLEASQEARFDSLACFGGG